MTLKEFFRRARRNRVWHVSHWHGYVRCTSGMCPLAAVTALWRPAAAAKQLGISTKMALKIARAADYRGSKHRRWLLKQLGVGA